MKKYIRLLIPTMITILLCNACKKDKEDIVLKKTLVGYWKGKSSLAANSDWSWLMRADNTMRVYIGADSSRPTSIGEGTYSNTDSTANISYKIRGFNNSYSALKINSSYTRIDGKDNLINTAFYVER